MILQEGAAAAAEEWMGVNGCAANQQMLAPSLIRGNITMILEVANLNMRPGGSADFERALAEARAISAAMAGSGWGRSADC